MDESAEAIPFLSTVPASRRERIAALALIVVSLAGLPVILHFGKTPWPLMVAFVPADDTGVLLIYFMTAALLIGQFIQVRLPSLVVLASGYMFACFVVIGHLLSYAQILRELRPASANDQSTAWLFVLWHGVFPLFVLAYALLVGRQADRPVGRARIGIAIGACVGTALTLTALSTWIATSWSRWLPIIFDTPNYSRLLTSGIAPAIWLLTAVTLVILYLRTRARRVLDLWLCVVLFAWLLDVLAGSIVNQMVSSFGWYAARVYSLLAAVVVLSSMLAETGRLYARLAKALADKQEQSAALSKSEAALRQAQKMEAIGQITGGVAHDFNNLLTVIIGSLDMLKHRVHADERSLRLTGYALDAATRGERLTKQLLAFSRRQVLHPEIVSPDQLIRDFGALLQRAVSGGVRIELDLVAADAFVVVDPAQFEAAILNLAVNARDAMAGAGTMTIGSRAITIGAGVSDLPAGDYVAVSVADTGSGMDAETVAHAFEPFFTTKAVGQGSGLGLSQVYGFITSAGGQVVIDSVLGVGTTVRLYFPRAAAPQAMSVAPRRTAPVDEAGKGETILVVEDDVTVLDVAVDVLSEAGYVVERAADGVEALRQLTRGRRIDLMFSDVVMPGGLNGIDLAREARQTRPDLRILLTSGYAAAALNGQASLPPGVEILAKPYRAEELIQKLRQMLDA